MVALNRLRGTTVAENAVGAGFIEEFALERRTASAAASPMDSPNLDLLRSFAVLCVVVSHMVVFEGRLFVGHLNVRALGIFGVLIFFVHTCLVLMRSLERQRQEQRPAALFLNFMIRRCFRILPLSLLVVTLVAALRLPLSSVQPHHFIGAELTPSIILTNLLLLQNLQPDQVSILGPLWSLPYEMQMYLFLPALFLLVRSSDSIWPILGVWLASIALAVVALDHPAIPWLVRFVPCFVPGVIAYQLQRNGGRGDGRWNAILWAPTLVALAVAYVAWVSEPAWLRRWAVCLILGLIVPQFAQISSRWLRRTCHVIAKYSYGIYLTHFFAIWFALEWLAPDRGVERAAVLIVIGVGLPVLFYHAIEEPMIRVGKRLAGRLVR